MDSWKFASLTNALVKQQYLKVRPISTGRTHFSSSTWQKGSREIGRKAKEMVTHASESSNAKKVETLYGKKWAETWREESKKEHEKRHGKLYIFM